MYDSLLDPMAFEPALCTEPLSPDFKSHADWLLPLMDIVYKSAGGKTFIFDHWQRELIRRMLEVYPDDHPRAGQLRFRRILVSMGRQNGKTDLGAVLSLYGLLREAGAEVYGVASSAKQATILYNRCLKTIMNHRTLKKRFTKATQTRGINAVSGGKYDIIAAKGEALQGLPVSLGLVDEVHICKPELWSSLVKGTGGRNNGLVIGITTAGDDKSELLKDLYRQAEMAIDGHPDHQRLGVFIWQAESDEIPKDDETWAKYLTQANPGVKCGRIDLENKIDDAKSTPEIDVIRYDFNRFVASVNNFIDPAKWVKLKSDSSIIPAGLPLIFCIGRTPDWKYATISVAAKDPVTKIIYTTLVASIVNPTREKIVKLAVDLKIHRPKKIVVEGYQFKDLVPDLTRRGLPIEVLAQGDIFNASSMFNSLILQGRIRHTNDLLIKRQLPYCVRKNVGDNFRISRADSLHEIDAIMATAEAVYISEIFEEKPLQAFSI